jgi:acetylornithine deacetylase/succinyl-diaminopimelate desuccinylase-like protein
MATAFTPTTCAPESVGAAAHRARWLRELSELLSFPSVSSQAVHRGDVAATARWLERHLHRIGMQATQVLPGANGGAPSVYAQWIKAPNRPTVLFYGHFDVQPAEPLDDWRTPPFRPTVVGQRLYARGASDDKGQFFIHLKAIESLLAENGRLPVNVKVWLEGEEEVGSPTIDAFLDREVDRLRADAIIVSDTQMAAPGRPAIIYGLRGMLDCTITARGPGRDLHSGLYGGAVQSPLQALCTIIAGLHNRQGRVTVPGFYARVRPVSLAERRDLRRHGPSDTALLADLGVPVGWGEPGFSMFERTTIRPYLTVTSLCDPSAPRGGKAAIPAHAVARLSLRLIPDQDPFEIAELLRRQLAQVPIADVALQLTVDGAAYPILLPRDTAATRAVVRAVVQAWGVLPIFTRNGGSIAAVERLYRRLKAPMTLLGFGLQSDRIHAANEHLHLPTFFRGVQTMRRFLVEYAR